MISGEVVDADAEVVGAFDGNADLLVELEAGAEARVVGCRGNVRLDGGAAGVDDGSILVVEVGEELDMRPGSCPRGSGRRRCRAGRLRSRWCSDDREASL